MLRVNSLQLRVTRAVPPRGDTNVRESLLTKGQVRTLFANSLAKPRTKGFNTGVSRFSPLSGDLPDQSPTVLPVVRWTQFPINRFKTGRERLSWYVRRLKFNLRLTVRQTISLGTVSSLTWHRIKSRAMLWLRNFLRESRINANARSHRLPAAERPTLSSVPFRTSEKRKAALERAPKPKALTSMRRLDDNSNVIDETELDSGKVKRKVLDKQAVMPEPPKVGWGYQAFLDFARKVRSQYSGQNISDREIVVEAIKSRRPTIPEDKVLDDIKYGATSLTVRFVRGVTFKVPIDMLVEEIPPHVNSVGQYVPKSFRIRPEISSREGVDKILLLKAMGIDLLEEKPFLSKSEYSDENDHNDHTSF